ncbi:MAG: class A beta-lactamase-related serine hydrolase [Bacteroidetes bacterium]|nr:MAG: class A beta-lactamase-related serine hydrolase [Bacteroidota bacterium]TAG86994.1 MAG: class A beta-lactamase-related serine hydrolase [Bacteroidota bacterium]
MYKTIFFLVSLIIFFLLATSCQNKKIKKEEKTLNQQIDSVKNKWSEVKKYTIDMILSEIARRYRWNGCLLVQENGKILLNRCYGTTDRYKRDLDNILNTQKAFHIGSVAQIFTASSIDLLVKQNKINTEDSLTKYFKNIKYKKLKIKHLLNHTSGLPDYQNYFLNSSSDINTYATNRNVIDWLIGSAPKLHFEPESDFQYSPSNYVLLARIVELVSQKIWIDFLKEDLCKGLKINQLYLPFLSEKKPIFCVDAFYLDRKKNFDDHFLQYIYGAEGLWASLNDLHEFENFYENDIFFDNEKEDNFVPSVLNNGKIVPFVKGWHIKQDEKLLFQTGKWLGFQTGIWWWREQKTKIILLTNDNSTIFLDTKTMIENILKGKRYKIPF